LCLLGKNGPKKPLPDNVTISEPKLEEDIQKPYSDVKVARPGLEQQPGVAALAQQPQPQLA
jgi:hypothetical protein